MAHVNFMKLFYEANLDTTLRMRVMYINNIVYIKNVNDKSTRALQMRCEGTWWSKSCGSYSKITYFEFKKAQNVVQSFHTILIMIMFHVHNQKRNVSLDLALENIDLLICSHK